MWRRLRRMKGKIMRIKTSSVSDTTWFWKTWFPTSFLVSNQASNSFNSWEIGQTSKKIAFSSLEFIFTSCPKNCCLKLLEVIEALYYFGVHQCPSYMRDQVWKGQVLKNRWCIYDGKKLACFLEIFHQYVAKTCIQCTC